MGWLFALALGLQERSERIIWRSLAPIALGHAASLAVVALAVGLLGAALPLRAVRLVAALVLLGFGLWKLARYYRHPRWVGMRVGLADLFGWSFLVASAHGAGLMVAPALVAIGPASALHPGGAAIRLVAGVGLHTAAMVSVMAAMAWIVYRRLGLGVLRRRWVNFDLIWAIALVATGALALAAGVRS